MSDKVIENSQQWVIEWQAIARERDELRAHVELLNERKCFVCTDWMKQAERAEAEVERLRAQADHTAESFAQRLTEADYRCAQTQAEVERLRGYLKYLIGKAQDADDIQWMDEIDRVLVSPKE